MVVDAAVDKICVAVGVGMLLNVGEIVDSGDGLDILER